MVKRRVAILVCLFCFCFSLISFCAQAASTANAKEPVSVDRECTLTICYAYDDILFADASVKLYRIADVSADFRYSLTPAFASSGLILNGVQTNGEWNVIRSTLETRILADSIEEDAQIKTDGLGQASFTALKPGMYLAMVEQILLDGIHYCFDSALVALPGLDVNGFCQYEVTVAAKAQALPPVNPDEELQLKVLKLWKGDEGRTDRPQSIEVEIFRDGISDRTVVLSEENHWAYQWSTKDSSVSWTVMERNIPSGYTMTVEVRDATFVLTNVRNGDAPENPDIPPTGDTSNLMFYIVCMVISGGILVILGVAGKRSNYEKSK